MRPHSGFLPADVLDPDGFVRVDRHLRLPGHPDVFAVGDVAASDPNRSSARNFGYRVVVANLRRLIAGDGRKLRAFRAPEYRWGSVLGVQDDGLVILQPDGKRVRVPRWLAQEVLLRLFVPARTSTARCDGRVGSGRAAQEIELLTCPGRGVPHRTPCEVLGVQRPLGHRSTAGLVTRVGHRPR